MEPDYKRYTQCSSNLLHSVFDYVYIKFVYLVDFLTSQPKHPIFLIFIYPGCKVSFYTCSQPYWWISLVGGSFMGNFRTVTLVSITSAQLVPTSNHIWKCINRRFDLLSLWYNVSLMWLLCRFASLLEMGCNSLSS